MQLSIIVINYNTFDLTCKCIKSVYESIDNLEFELIVVDNASVECSPQRIKDLFPDIILLTLSKNLGFAGGNNAGYAISQGDIVLLLNSDTEVVGKAINIEYEYLALHNNVGVVSSKLIYPSGEIQGCCRRFPSITLELIELTRIQKLLGKRREEIMQGSFFDHLREMEA